MSELVEKHRIAMAEWLDLQEAADLLEGTKHETFAEMCSRYDCKSEAEKARICRISNDWQSHNQKIIEAASKARRARMRVKHRQMEFDAWRTEAANNRQERGNY